MAYGGGYAGGYHDGPRAGIEPFVTIEWSPTTNPLDTPVWVEITGWRAIQTNRGRQNEVDQIQAGTASIVLDNRDRRFDPLYTAGPNYGNVLPMKRFRIQSSNDGVVDDIFQGFVDSWDQSYVNPNDGTVEVRLIDFFEVLNSAAFSPSPYEVEIRADGPVVWYRLGEPPDAGVVTDVMAGATGAVVGGVVFGSVGAISSDVDTAASFDGAGAYVSLGGALVSAFPYSIEVWIKVSDRSGELGDRYFYTQSPDYNVSPNGQPAGFVNGNDFAHPGRLHWDSLDTGGTRVDDGAWHHVVLTATGSGAGAQTLYLDGVAVATGTATTPGQGPGPQVRLGYPADAPFVSISRNSWLGDIDDVAVYNTALSAARVAIHNQTARAPWLGDTTSERVNRILDYLGVAAGDRDIDTTLLTLQEAFELGSTLLAHLQAVNEVEQGLLFVGKDGKIRFRSRYSGLNLASQGTFGDGPGELRYRDISFDYSKQLVYNVIRRQNQDGQLMEVSDAASIASYGRRVDSKTGLYGDSDLVALDMANYRLSNAKAPVQRVTQISLSPERDPTTLYPQVLGREIGEQVTIKRRPQGVGSAISFDARLEGIAHSITPSSWATIFRLSPADAGVYLQLDLASGPGLDSLKLAF